MNSVLWVLSVFQWCRVMLVVFGLFVCYFPRSYFNFILVAFSFCFYNFIIFFFFFRSNWKDRSVNICEEKNSACACGHEPVCVCLCTTVSMCTLFFHFILFLLASNIVSNQNKCCACCKSKLKWYSFILFSNCSVQLCYVLWIG